MWTNENRARYDRSGLRYPTTGSGFPCSAFEKVIEKTKLRKMGRRCAEF